MTLEMEISDALHQSFRAALVLTGGIEGAERAVTNGIIALESDLSADALLVETARSAIENSTVSDGLSPVLPLEFTGAISPFANLPSVFRAACPHGLRP